MYGPSSVGWKNGLLIFFFFFSTLGHFGEDKNGFDSMISDGQFDLDFFTWRKPKEKKKRDWFQPAHNQRWTQTEITLLVSFRIGRSSVFGP